MKKKSLLVLIMITALFLTACGTSSTSSKEQYAAATISAAYDNMGAEADYSTISGSTVSNSSTTQLSDARKWIITVNINAETEDMDAMLETIMGKTGALGGYVENQSIYNGSSSYTYRYREASLVIRVPADQVDSFVEQVGDVSNVISNNRYVEDVTLQYSATENRIKALETEEARLLELMEQAENLTDLLEIESRLTDVRYELENVSSRIRLMDNQIDYATIHLNISEVKEYTPVAERTFFERIRDGFMENLGDLKDWFEDFIVWLISSLPTLIVLAAVVAVIVVIIRSSLKRSRKRRMERWKAAQERVQKTESEIENNN